MRPSPKLVRVATYSIAVTLVGAWGAFAALSDGPQAPHGRLGGDFPAFYGAGFVVTQGRGAWLYDEDTQRQSQKGLLPTEPSDSWIPYPYPAAVALPFAAFALLPFRAAYVLYGLLLLAALWFASYRLRGSVPLTAPATLIACAFLCFPPLAESVRAGQSTAWMLLLFGVGAHSLKLGRTYGAGLSVGALWFKPHIAAPLFCWLLLTRRWKDSMVALSGLLAYYALGAWVAGPDWPLRWWSFLSGFFVDYSRSNADLSVSLAAQLGNLIGVSPVALSAVFLIPVVLISARVASSETVASVWTALAVIAVVLGPHALYYDGGVLVLCMAILWPDSRKIAAGLAVGGSLGLLYPAILTVAMCTGAALVLRRGCSSTAS